MGLEEALRLHGVLERAEPLKHSARRPPDLLLEPRETLEGRLPLRRGAVAKEALLESGEALCHRRWALCSLRRGGRCGQSQVKSATLEAASSSP